MSWTLQLTSNRHGNIAPAAVLTIMLITSPTHAADLSGIMKSQSAFATNTGNSQQQEWLLDVEYQTSLLGGDVTAIGRVRYDTDAELNRRHRPATYASINGPSVNGPDGMLELRELYWETATANTYWRIGKQQVVWGEADGLKLLDVINPQSYREFILDDTDDSRIPLWMLNLEHNLTDNSVLQILLIPDTTVHDLAPTGSPYALSSPKQVPQQEALLTAARTLGATTVIQSEAQASAKIVKDGDAGLRLTSFMGGWDVSLNYLYHTVDTPVVHTYQQANLLIVEPVYERSHLWGGTVSNAFGDWTLRAEFAYETNRYHRTQGALPGVEKADQWSSVIGLDWQGWSDQFVSVQWFQTTTTGNSKRLVNSQHEQVASLLWEAKFYNETLTLSWLHLHSLNHKDGLARPKIVYNLESNVDIYVGADVFYGNDEGLFGQFEQEDRVTLGFEWGF